MARLKNFNWKLSEGNASVSGVRTYPHDDIKMALLMDIRDELQTLNRLLSYPNFISISSKLDAIRRNTEKPKRRRLKIAK